jgi:anion-transporting  ArsA/GET3 family ATPase
MPAENTDGRNSDGASGAGLTAAVFSDEANDACLNTLLARRLVFVMGKGGVGKTTVSVILAYIAERMNKKVLLVELGDTDSIGKLYQDQALTELPRQLSQNIWGARVNAKAELEAYVRAHVAPRIIANKIIRSRLFDYLFEAAPGLKEVMSLGRLWRWEKEKTAPLAGSNTSGRDSDRGDSTGADPFAKTFDLIIVDAPATGHAMSLLRLPDSLIRMIRVGPLANQIRGLQQLLKDHRKTGLVLVSLPEELPANETVEFYSMAEQTLDMPVVATFINCVYPCVFNKSDLQQLAEVKNSCRNRSDEENRLLSSADSLILRHTVQQKHIKRIYDHAGKSVLKIPFCFTNDLTLHEIRELSLLIYPSPPLSSLYGNKS